MARSPKRTASKSGRGIKARGRPPAKRTAASKKQKPTASRKTVSKTGAARKRTPAKTAPSKSKASKSRGGSEVRGRAANTASRATKTVSKKASASRKQSTAKRAQRRSGAERMRRTDNANLGAAVTNPVTDAMALGTEVVAGAIQAGGKIVAASADMAESAARAATAVTTGVVSEGSQQGQAEGFQEAKAGTKGRGRRKLGSTGG